MCSSDLSTTIYIRFNPASTGSFSGSITHASVGAADVNLAVNGFSLASEPVTPSTISFGTISGNSIVVNTAGGSGTSRIIVIRQANAVSFSPTDGQAVTGVNSIFTSATDQGSGNKIVYDGTGNTVTVTGLSANTPYYFTVFEYNGNAATSNYQLTGAGTATTSTIESEPTTSATVTLTRMKTDSSFISFAGGNGTGRIVILSTSSVSFVPVDGLTYTGASSDFTSAPDLGSGNKLIFSGPASTTMYITGLAAGTKIGRAHV